jgi:acetyl esterase/lipase
MADDASVRITAGTEGREVIALWSAPPPRQIENYPAGEQAWVPPLGLAERKVFLRNVSEPTLTVFSPEPARANGVGVIVCPGGGWQVLAWEHEGLEVARWLNGRGYTAFLLKYRVSPTPASLDAFLAQQASVGALHAGKPTSAQSPRTMDDLMGELGRSVLGHARDVAADDGRRALALVRERAAEFGVNPAKVGMIGFSAGAFLVADVAVDPQGSQPAFIAPIYGGETRGKPVPSDAAPMFTVVAQDDRLLFHMVEGLYLAWSEADRSAELHIFARGAHGFGLIQQGLPSDRWIDLFDAWLADHGFG